MPLARKPDAYKNINSSSVIITKQIQVGPSKIQIQKTTKDDIQITSELLIPWVFIK
jgi:hypothetical protein